MGQRREDTDERALVESAGEAARYALAQLEKAASYYRRAASAAKRAALFHVALARGCYFLSGLLLTLTVASAWESTLALIPGEGGAIAAALGLPLAAPKWSVAVIALGYLVSQYAQRRGHTRAWTRYSRAKEAVEAARRSYVVALGAAPDVAARNQVTIESVSLLNSILAEETAAWARDLMSDLDRVHALLRERGELNLRSGDEAPA